jgi:hypothetical protein
MTTLPRRRWVDLLAGFWREVRTTALALATIWSLLWSTGFVDRVWPADESVVVAKAELTLPSPVFAGGALSGDLFPIEQALPEGIIEVPVPQIGTAVQLACPFDNGCASATFRPLVGAKALSMPTRLEPDLAAVVVTQEGDPWPLILAGIGTAVLALLFALFWHWASRKLRRAGLR